MKNIQIKQELFIKLIQYFYSEEIGYDNEELFDLEREIKAELQKKLDKVSMRSYYTAYKLLPQSRSVRKHAKNISMKEVCLRAIDGNFSLRDIYGNVPHSRVGN